MSSSSRPVRVVFLDHVARLAGAEICLVRLVRATDQIEATVLLAEDGPLVHELTEAGARVEILPMAEGVRGLTREELSTRRTRAGASVEVARYTNRLRKRLRQLQPDVVHTNSLKSGVYGTPAARLAGLPCVWYLHDHLSPEYLPRQLVRTMRLMVSTLPSALVVPSQSTLRSVGKRRRPGLRTSVIPCPVPMPDEPAEISREVRQVGLVGRLAPWKGQDVFLEAFARAFPDSSVRARLIGSAMFGEEGYERELRERAERLGIADRTDFVGFVNDVPAELRRLDLLVHSSVLPDPLATSALEGMGAGVPVISANAGGPGEYIIDGREGLLHEPGDVEGLAAALRRAAADPDLRAAIAAGGRKKAFEFTPDVVVPKLLDLYRAVARSALMSGSGP
jgi:glycosyltransferase involved in cell wall biosynthesis